MAAQERLVTVGDLEVFKAGLICALSAELKVLLSGAKPVAKKWLKSKEVRKLLGISPGKLQSMRNKRELPYTPIGGVFYYAEEDVLALMELNKVQ
ncbi:DNA-binding protein [Taibaiella sp. KBW10]|nr:DNA-binding protein [Taibaiella sp. KBW10]